MKKSFFVGIGVCVLGFIVLLVAFYAMYMNGGTRLLYENSVWGARWRNYPWVFLAAAVLFAGGGVLLKVGYVPKAKRPKKVRPVAVPKMVSPSAADTGAAGTPSPALQEPAVSFDLNGGEESSAPAAAATVEEKAEKNVEQAAPVPYGQDENTTPSAPVASVPAQPAVSFNLDGGMEPSAPAQQRTSVNFDLSGVSQNTVSMPWQSGVSFNLSGVEEAPAQRPEQSYEGFTLEQQQTKQEQPAGKRCPVCGKENGPEFHFCANCGTKL